MSDLSLRQLAYASVGAGLVTFVLRLAAFNGFENDHFMHLAWAQQLVFGALPGRDFVEPGMPLVILLSALAQAAWPGFLSEALLGTALIGVAAGFACVVAARLTRSIPAGLTASLLVLALYPRLYSYPKILVPAVALWLVLRYSRRRSRARLWATAAWSVVAFLLRHDLGVMTALAMGAGILVDATSSFRARIAATMRFVGVGLLLVAPYLAYLEWTEGLLEHVRVGTEFSKGEQHQLLWTGPSMWAGPSDLRLDFLAPALSAEATLFWLFTALVVVLAWWCVREGEPSQRAAMVTLFVFAVAYRLVILRYPLRARLPDTAAVAAIAAAIGLARFAAAVVRAVHARPLLAAACAVGGFVIASTAAAAVWTTVNLGDRFSQAGLGRGPFGVAITLRDVLRRAPDRSWSPYWPAGDVPPVVDYLARCTTSSHRVLVTWFAPEYYVFSGRGFAAGQVLFLSTSFASARDQAQMLERLERESVPVVLVNETEHEAFARAFPAVAAYISTRYTTRLRFNHNEETVVGVAFPNGARGPIVDGDGRWACGA